MHVKSGMEEQIIYAMSTNQHAGRFVTPKVAVSYKQQPYKDGEYDNETNMIFILYFS